MRLRSLFLIGAVVLAFLSGGSAAGLFWMSAQFQSRTRNLSQSIERVHATEQLALSLFMLQVVREFASIHAPPGTGPRVSEDDARQRVLELLRQVEPYAGTATEQALLSEARGQVEAYLQAPEHERMPHLRRAVAAMEAVSLASIERAHAVRDEAERVSGATRLLAGLLTLSIVTGVALLLAAIRTRLYLPLLSIRRALAAFKSGQRESRVAPVGAVELREVAAEFNDMADTLVSQDARQVQFLAGVAHDLRTPLNALKLATRVLLKSPEPPPPEKVRESLVRISTQLDRLDRMVGDLLEQTRIEAGNLELRPEDCDLRQLVTDVVELHRPLSQQHHLELTVPDQPVPVRGDPTRLTQVLTNLLSNAIKYSPRGGRVRVRLEGSPEEARVSVSDEGVGIPADEYERIFEPFRRSKHSRAEIPGVGLGLSVSRRIVRAHGGDIEVESRVGGGSTFRVRLPLAQP
ncbi:HAMP domain-containing histidine kinase [Pyxidicoccus fallax]|uniref:histidine kinase n=1 Tax=Pyxidicoccus fallax TaxID=394095 RepID=A0A848LPY5_9BACT|nr:HAMP domain-containing sensor histidine kinase [Pyxidicoccus fallax]NMO19816.1 HAMP domain-containing histidine kinase [Pyxidicoccus fallax]NPC77333.1 HAMP domain-containing histidine kinase [Pyxidicoccus fallax]